MHRTSDTLFDPATEKTYHVVDVQAALNEVLSLGPTVQQRDGVLTIAGTQGQDVIRVDTSGSIDVNGQHFAFRPDQLETMVITGNQSDQLQLFLRTPHTQIELLPGSLATRSDTFDISAAGFSQIQVYATGSASTAVFSGGDGPDRFVSKSTHSWMQGTDFLNYVRGADSVRATGDRNGDTALLYDSSGDDVLTTRPQRQRS